MSWLEGRQKQQGVGDAFVSFRVSSASWESVCVVGWSGLCSTHISSSGSRPYCVLRVPWGSWEWCWLHISEQETREVVMLGWEEVLGPCSLLAQPHTGELHCPCEQGTAARTGTPGWDLGPAEPGSKNGSPNHLLTTSSSPSHPSVSLPPAPGCACPAVVSLESRSLHLSTLLREAEQRVNELTAQVVNEAPNADCSEKEKQLKAWEWRYRLYKRMKAGFEHARECPKQGWGWSGAGCGMGRNRGAPAGDPAPCSLWYGWVRGQAP